MKTFCLALALLPALGAALLPTSLQSRIVGNGARFAPSRSVERMAVEEDEELEVAKEAAIIAKKKRSNMFNENGVAYAPWMVSQIDEDAFATAKELRRLRKKAEAEEKARLDGGVMRGQTVAGMNTKVVDGEVELSWFTTTEVDNVGYLVQKKESGGGAFETVASYKDWAPLNSKGPDGGKYTFVDPTTEIGDWVYRVVDVDQAGAKTVMCQSSVEVQSSGEQALQLAVTGLLVAVLAGAGFAASMIDPIQ